MEVSILRTLTSLNARATQGESAASRYKKELARARYSLVEQEIDLKESERVAELLYGVHQKLGLVTDYLLKRQEPLDGQDCNSFEAMFNIIIKQAKSHGGGAEMDDGNDDSQDRAGNPGEVVR